MSLAYLFKNVYAQGEVPDLTLNSKPFTAMVPKSTKVGKPIVHAWKGSNPAGTSMSFSSSLAQQDSQSGGNQMLAQLSQIYHIFRLDIKEMRISMAGDAQAYVNTKKNEMTGVMNKVTQELDLALHRAGNGIVGTIASVTGNVIAFNPDVVMSQFEVGFQYQNVTTSPVDGTAPTLGAGLATVTKVNYFGKSITVDDATGFAATNGVVRRGNALGFSATNSSGNIIGQGNWVPLVDPTPGENWLASGLDRTTDTVRYSGFRTAAGGRDYFEAIQENMAAIHDMGGRVDFVQLNPIDWQRANIQMQNSVRRGEAKVGKVAFATLEFTGPSGNTVRVVSDPNMQFGKGRTNTLDSWLLRHLDELPHLADEDGNTSLRDGTSDAIQIRVRAWPQLFCDEPRANGVVDFLS